MPANSSSTSSAVQPHGSRHRQYPAPRVLLADAHADTRDLYTVWLTQRGFVVLSAATGAELAALARVQAPDVVVTELVLPGGGPALVRSLRAEAATADAVVIVLTTQTGGPLREQALAAGADCYLVKPCGATRLGEAMVTASRTRFREAVPSRRHRDAVLRAAQRAFAIRERIAIGDVFVPDSITD